MEISKQANSGELTAKCVCGRSALIIHCPACGSADLYAYARLTTAIAKNGKPEKVQTYRCRRCGKRFIEGEWQLNCQAPRRRSNQHDKDFNPVETPIQREELIQHFQQLEDLKKLL